MSNYNSDLQFSQDNAASQQIRKSLEVELHNLEQQLLIAQMNCRSNPGSEYCEMIPQLREEVKAASQKYFQEWGKIYRRQLEC